MKKIRIGNDIKIRWTILNGDKPYPLEDKSLQVYLSNYKGTYNIKAFEAKDNVLSFTCYGKDQGDFGYGKYRVTLVENNNEKGMVTVDECDAFELVRFSCDAGGMAQDGNVSVDTLNLQSRTDIVQVYPIIPIIGANGNWFVEGEDTGKPSRGDKGDAFKYEDFTPEQLEKLRGPRGFEGSVLYPKFEVRDDMHLVMEEEIETNRISFNEETGYITFNI